MWRATLIVVVVVVVGAGCSSSTRSVTPAPSTATTAMPTSGCTSSTAHHDLHYGMTPGVAANTQSVDLYVPRCKPGGVVVYVHGGGFVNGDKANQIANKVKLFTSAGYAFASVNYRLDVQYPAAEQDVGNTIGYLAEHATQYGYDPHRLLLLGHSSGAFLVALLSTDASFVQAAGVALSDIRCTVPLDTTYDIAYQMAHTTPEARMYRNAFGNDPAVWTRGSPIDNIAADKHIPAFHIVTRGQPDRIAQAQAFGAVLHGAGVREDVQVARGLSHDEVNQAIGAPGDTMVTRPLMNFYASCR